MCFKIIILFFGDVLGSVILRREPSSQNLINGENVKFTCTVNPLTRSVSWDTPVGTALAQCASGADFCNPAANSPSRYSYTSTVANNQFYLDINDVTLADIGVFQCKQNTQPQEMSNGVQVEVIVGIQYVTLTKPTQNSITVLDNRETQFECVTSAGRPQATGKWYLDTPATTDNDIEITTGISTSSAPSSGDARLSITTSTLRFTPTKATTGSKIYCRAYTIQSEIKTSTKLLYTTLYPPTIATIQDKSVIEGKSISLVCSTTPGNPSTTTYSWTRSTDNWSRSAASFTLAPVSKGDAADYTCKAENSMLATGDSTSTPGVDTEIFTVTVLNPASKPVCTFNGQPIYDTATIKVIKDTAVTISCSSSGNPTPGYSWNHPDGTTTSNKILNLGNIQTQQAGQFTLTATNIMNPTEGSNEQGSSQFRVTLNVLYSPSTPSLLYKSSTNNGASITTNSFDVVRGDTFQIVCSSQAEPSPTYTWNIPTYTDQTLTISGIDGNKAARCNAINIMVPTFGNTATGSATVTVSINEWYGPSEPSLTYNYAVGQSLTLTGTLYMIEGDSGSITCHGSSSKPSQTSYSWPNSNLPSTAGTLQINNVNTAMSGSYMCEVQNTMTRTFDAASVGKNNKPLTLSVLFAPSLKTLSPRSVNEGSPLSVMCATTAGNPPETTYTWTRSGDSWRQTSQTMSIQQTSRTDDGDYTCKVQNIMVPTKPGSTQQGIDTATFSLTINYAPDVTVTTTNTTVNANSVDIVCSPSGVPAIYTYQPWTQHWGPGVEIIHTPGLGNNPTLQLTQLSYQHSGIYTCTAGNGVLASNNPGAGSGSVYLLVKSQPIVTKPKYNNGDHHKLSIALNTASSLVLEYYSNAGDTTVTVNSKIGGNIGANVFTIGAPTQTNVQLPVFAKTVTAPGMTTTLTLTIKEQQQFGRYEIVLKNDNDLPDTLLIVDVTPKQPPEVPSYMTLANVTQTTATLTWIRGFHGGSDQSFVVQLSQDNIQWTNKTLVNDGQKDSNTTVTVTIDGLTPGTKYHVRVFAFNQEGHNDEYSNVHDFNTEIETNEQTSSLGGVIGGTIAGVVVIVLVVVAVVLARRYDVNLACKCTCKKKIANPDTTQDSKTYYENVRENKVANTQGSAASEQVSYYNIGRESEEPVPSTYETISDREPTPNMYSSIQNIEMATTRNIASDPAVSEPIQSQYESLTDREAAPNMYSSLDNIDSSPGGNVASNPGHVYYNLKV